MSSQNLRYTISLNDLFSKKLSGIHSNVSRLDKGMSRLGRGIAAYFSIGAIKNFGSAIVESLKNYEYFSTALRTLLKGNSQQAEALQTQLISLAATTPFSLTEVQDGSKQLIAYGVAAGDVTSTIRTLGDVAAGLKIPFGDIAYLYGTLKTQGRAFSKDIYQFTNRGIPIVKELAKQFNVTDDKVMGLVTDGKVGFKEIEKAFKSMTMEGGQFFKMMEAQSKTVGGQISNLDDTWEQIKVNIGKSQRGIIASTVAFVSQTASAMNDYLVHSNRMEENFEKFGANQISYWQSFRDTLIETIDFLKIFGVTATTQLRIFDVQLNKFIQGSSSSVEKSIKARAGLLNYANKIYENFKSGKINKDTFDKQIALIKGGLNTVEGNISLFGAKENPSSDISGTGGGGTGSNLEAGASVTGARPQSLTINITKLVESLNVTTQNMKESAMKIKEEVAKALLEAVNDANYIVR